MEPEAGTGPAAYWGRAVLQLGAGVQPRAESPDGAGGKADEAPKTPLPHRRLSSQDPRAGIRAEPEAPFLPLGEGCHGRGGRRGAEAGVLSV